MWNETAMHHHQEDGRGQVSAWSVPLILFALMTAVSLLNGPREPAGSEFRSPAEAAIAHACFDDGHRSTCRL